MKDLRSSIAGMSVKQDTQHELICDLRSRVDHGRAERQQGVRRLEETGSPE